MEKINIKSLGPIATANITFGDLTLLVGPQASGKSIFLQILRLIADRDYILWTLNRYGYVWNDMNTLLDLFLGEGMSQIWNEKTYITVDGKRIGKSYFQKLPEKTSYIEQVFYIPAQRILALQNGTGWPKPFSDFNSDDSFVLKDFSELLRRPMNSGWPNAFLGQHNNNIKNYGYDDVFYNGHVSIDSTGTRKRFVLDVDNSKIPFMAWSTGQKEYMPLWAGLTLLNGVRKALEPLQTVIIEEPEMGLHPNAIKMLIVDVLRLISLGYKVIISTHSPVFLEFAWAFKAMQESGLDEQELYEMFDLKKSDQLDKIFKGLFKKTVQTYYFDRDQNSTTVKDISSLDAGSNNDSIAEWGGLSSFSGKASDMVLKAAINEQSSN